MFLASPARVADTEVRAQRRRFSAACKLRLLEEAEACTEPGAKGCKRRTAGRELARLRQEHARLPAEWAQARKVMDVQGKGSGLSRQHADKSPRPPSAK